MAACSFKAIVGGPCSYDRRYQSQSVNEVLLLSCVKDIERPKSLWSFTGVLNWGARAHSSKSGYFHGATGCQRCNHLSLTFIALTLALDGEGAPIHVEFQTRLHITVRVKELQSL